jgi:hypothetical protein
LGGGGGGGGGCGIVNVFPPFLAVMGGFSGDVPNSGLVAGLLQPNAAARQANPANKGRFHEGMKVSTDG